MHAARVAACRQLHPVVRLPATDDSNVQVGGRLALHAGSARTPPGSSKSTASTNPLGGFGRFQEMGLENKTAPYYLHQAGYRTGMIGK